MRFPKPRPSLERLHPRFEIDGMTGMKWQMVEPIHFRLIYQREPNRRDR